MLDNKQNVTIKTKEIANAISALASRMCSSEADKEFIKITDPKDGDFYFQKWNIKSVSGNGLDCDEYCNSYLYLYTGESHSFSLTIEELVKQLGIVQE